MTDQESVFYEPEHNIEYRAAEIERRTIDVIPLEERHGTVRDQFTFWFAATMNVINIVLGGVVVYLGLSFGWACIAIPLGSIFGAIFVSSHALQGPKLGVPQMIQSRGQFGFYGAIIVFAASIVLDFGFVAAQLVIQGEAMHLVIGSISIPVWIVIFALPVVVLTTYGYKWIHIWQRWFSIVLGVTFIVIFIQALAFGSLPGEVSGFTMPAFAAFMAAVSLFVVDSISWAPYVSDYSRYLPPDVPARRTFWAVTLGLIIPQSFCGILGAYIVGLLPESVSTVSALQQISGNWVLVVIAFGLIGISAISTYTGMLAVASIASCVREVRNSVTMRIGGLLLILVAATVAAVLGYREFVSNLQEFLNLLLFLFIPWSAINLTDYYLIERGRYDVKSFFTPKGMYGCWMWRGLIPYFAAIALEVPFVEQELFTGPLASSFNGVDISWIVGGVAAFVLYYAAAKMFPHSYDPGEEGDEPEVEAVGG